MGIILVVSSSRLGGLGYLGDDVLPSYVVILSETIINLKDPFENNQYYGSIGYFSLGILVSWNQNTMCLAAWTYPINFLTL